MTQAFVQWILLGCLIFITSTLTARINSKNPDYLNKEYDPMWLEEPVPQIQSEQVGKENLDLGIGNVGCTFSNAVCDPKLEFCYDDNAFGRCLAQFGSPTQSSLYRYSLSKSDMHLLEGEIERLFSQGYRWGHSYTQCVLQNLLNALRHGLDLKKVTAQCSEIQDQDLKSLADGMDPADLAFIKFAPTATKDNHASDFANEVYAPAEEQEPQPRSALDEIKSMQNENPVLTKEDENLLDALLQNYLIDELGLGDDAYPPQKKSEGYENVPTKWEDYPAGDEEMGLRVDEQILQPKVFSKLYNTPELFRNGIESRDAYPMDDAIPNFGIEQLTKSESSGEDIPLEFLEGGGDGGRIQELNEDAVVKELEREVEDMIINDAIEQAQKIEEANKERNDEGLYTEGGLVFVNNNPKRFLFDGEDNNGGNPGDELDDEELQVEFGLGGGDNGNGFERRERLDVKKPGPWYRTVNNFAFDYEEQQKEKKRVQDENRFNAEFGGLGPADMMGDLQIPRALSRKLSQIPISNVLAEDNSQGNNQQGELMELMTKKASSTILNPNLLGKTSAVGDTDSDQLDIIDTSYVNVVVSNRIGGWNMAQDLVNLLADLLDLKHSAFIEVRQTGDVVTFKVEPNEKKLNSTEVARRIESLSPEVEKESGVKIIKARVGVRTNTENQEKVSSRSFEEDEGSDSSPIPSTKYSKSTLREARKIPSNSPEQLPLYADSPNNNLYIATFATCGIVAAILVAAVTIFFVRKNAKSKEKFARLAQDDPSMEACRDYQDLCRARMASKNNEKTEPLRAVQRVQSHASRDSEGGTSSSRSSTSSWTEEPVHSNMDISTGHMVLSYMEDHLKNKDRLDQEWAALCAYEADPGATTIAEKPENMKSNRFSNSLPFDHSRVILNDLANITGSDYINASTITDHDPRNPAYIATQGPLPNTSADFWQMVWEQGSVVIVSLTRLSDNGTTLCHRYWPEEGSELLHIYEVHLVSEHIWCEEYLVRSFYLKNVKTGETRTVTQFQFLAWPENGIPSSTKALLEFRRKVNKSYRGRSCPIIVHCSDGAGRTGTYCLIDMVLNRMRKGAKEIDIAASLEHIRDQRPGMVRTKQQFEFVLMAVAEEVHAILKALPQ